MQVLTIALFAYVAFIAVDFAYGLWQLWQSSAAQPEAPALSGYTQSTRPEVSDPWFEPLAEVAVIAGKQEQKLKPQLLLAPAKECDLSKMTVAELRKMAQALKVKGARAMKKKDLLTALS
jgi:hypothetical protein